MASRRTPLPRLNPMALAALCLSHPIAFAQTTAVNPAAQSTPAADASQPQALQEIVVTSERQSSRQLKAPLAVSVISGSDIQQKGATTFQQVLQSVPALIIQKPDDTEQGGPPVIAIRGLGADSTGTQPATAIYEDGVLVTGSNSFFYDLSRVEVLRGPQGTLYGQGATGGAVNVIHKDPTHDFGVDTQLEIGNYNNLHTTVAVNTPVTDSLAMRFAVNQVKHDGYNSNGYGAADLINTRLTGLFEPTKNLSVLFGGVYFHSKNQGEIETPLKADGSISSDLYQPDPAGGSKALDYSRYFANVRYNAGPFQITWIPAVQDNQLDLNAYGGPGIQVGGKTDRTHTEEFRISNAPDSSIKWVAGVYYLDNKNHNVFHGGFPIDYATRTYTPLLINVDQAEHRTATAVFGETTIPLSSDVRMTAGLRQQKTSISYQEGDVNFGAPTNYDVNLNYNRSDYRIRLDADLDKNSLVYGSVSTAARPGGVGANGTKFGPEGVTAIEAGYKTKMADGRVQLSLSAYNYDYSGFQSPVPVVDPSNPGAIVGWTVSVIPAKFRGLEMELAAKLTKDDVLTFAPAWEQAEYTQNYTISPSGPVPALVTVYSKGKTPPHVPKWSLSSSFAHTFHIDNGDKVVASLSGKYQSQQYNTLDSSLYGTAADAAGTVTPNPAYVTKAYALFDGLLTYARGDGDWSVSGYVRNMTNTHYKLNVIPGAAGLVARTNDPRTFGVIVSKQF